MPKELSSRTTVHRHYVWSIPWPWIYNSRFSKSLPYFKQNPMFFWQICTAEYCSWSQRTRVWRCCWLWEATLQAVRTLRPSAPAVSNVNCSLTTPSPSSGNTALMGWTSTGSTLPAPTRRTSHSFWRFGLKIAIRVKQSRATRLEFLSARTERYWVWIKFTLKGIIRHKPVRAKILAGAFESTRTLGSQSSQPTVSLMELLFDSQPCLWECCFIRQEPWVQTV